MVEKRTGFQPFAMERALLLDAVVPCGRKSNIGCLAAISILARYSFTILQSYGWACGNGLA